MNTVEQQHLNRQGLMHELSTRLMKGFTHDGSSDSDTGTIGTYLSNDVDYNIRYREGRKQGQNRARDRKTAAKR